MFVPNFLHETSSHPIGELGTLVTDNVLRDPEEPEFMVE